MNTGNLDTIVGNGLPTSEISEVDQIRFDELNSC